MEDNLIYTSNDYKQYLLHQNYWCYLLVLNCETFVSLRYTFCYVEHALRGQGIPYTSLIIDRHSTNKAAVGTIFYIPIFFAILLIRVLLADKKFMD